MQHALRHPSRTLLVALVVALGAVALVAAVAAVRDDGGTTTIVRTVTQGSGVATGTHGSGVAVSELRSVPPFSSVDLAGANVVRVRVGGARRVVVRGDDNLVPLVTTDVEAGTLVIGNRGSFTTESPMSVEVTVPSLHAVTLGGSGTVSARGVRADALVVELSGSGNVDARGRADRLTAKLSGSGQLLLAGLASRDAAADLQGSGRISLTADRSLAATLAGVGTIDYGGNPANVSQSVTGTGTIATR